MKKTVTRGHAIWMYNHLSKMSFCYFNEEDLEKMMDNYAAINSIVEDYNNLNIELRKRLYGDLDSNKIDEFNTALTKAKKIKNLEEKIVALKTVETSYPELYTLLNKQLRVSESLKTKEVEIDINPIDKDSFMRAAIKAKADIPQKDYDLFAPLYTNKEEERVNDFSELDELLK